MRRLQALCPCCQSIPTKHPLGFPLRIFRNNLVRRTRSYAVPKLPTKSVLYGLKDEEHRRGLTAPLSDVTALQAMARRPSRVRAFQLGCPPRAMRWVLGAFGQSLFAIGGWPLLRFWRTAWCPVSHHQFFTK